MREIKFRAWDRDHMIYEDLSLDGTGSPKMKSCDILELYTNVMQFTGLLDKNGKKIYEGDILKAIGLMFDEVVFEVKDIHFLCIHKGYEDYEVIGNIYEHQDLLKRGEE